MEFLVHDFVGKEPLHELRSLISMFQWHALETQGLFSAWETWSTETDETHFGY